MSVQDCVLFSGGAPGAEAAFGRCAEDYDIQEVNFSFEGHKIERSRGVRGLTAEELSKGDVSLAYVSRLMNRRYTESPAFRKILQTIWHQVINGQQVFVVGKILSDGTVKGGTGWGAELGKLFNKPLFVFDQDANAWFAWDERQWRRQSLDDEPRIAASRFTGTGTRHLNENGRRAIEEIFARSFKAQPEPALA